MKKSKLLESIEYLLFQTENLHNFDRAGKILKLIEDIGMLPPDCSPVQGIHINEWEPESN